MHAWTRFWRLEKNYFAESWVNLPNFSHDLHFQLVVGALAYTVFFLQREFAFKNISHSFNKANFYGNAQLRKHAVWRSKPHFVCTRTSSAARLVTLTMTASVLCHCIYQASVLLLLQLDYSQLIFMLPGNGLESPYGLFWNTRYLVPST